MAEGSSTPLRSLLNSMGIKRGASKRLKFMPNITEAPSGNKDAEPSTTQSQKEHRRAQVRKAQKLHRQHKKNYVKFLEQDVTRLREMISAVESETAIYQQENAAIRTTLFSNGVQASPAQLPVVDTHPFTSGVAGELASVQGTQNGLLDNGQLLQQSTLWAPQPTMTISVAYDERINDSRLRVSPASDFSSQDQSNASLSFPGNADTGLELLDPATLFGEPPAHLADLGAGGLETMPKQLDTSVVGINFILALEHPCRTHFNAPEAEFDPEGASCDHELMATALLYSQAPAPIFSNLETATWQSPELELTKLWEMSQSLPKGDWEITPVQAWFLLTAAYDVSTLLADDGKRLDALTRGLARYVDCLGFGTALDVGRFWGVVNAVMGTEGAIGSS